MYFRRWKHIHSLQEACDRKDCFCLYGPNFLWHFNMQLWSKTKSTNGSHRAHLFTSLKKEFISSNYTLVHPHILATRHHFLPFSIRWVLAERWCLFLVNHSNLTPIIQLLAVDYSTTLCWEEQRDVSDVRGAQPQLWSHNSLKFP